MKLIDKFGFSNVLIKDKAVKLKEKFVEAVNDAEKLDGLLKARTQVKGAANQLPRGRKSSETCGDLYAQHSNCTPVE